jgi:uridine kinase
MPNSSPPAVLLPSDLDILTVFSKPEDRHELLPYLEACELEPNDILLEEGTDGDAMFFILRGQAQICRAGLQLGSLAAGYHVGELGLITGRPRNASVKAVTPLFAARLSVDNFERLKAEKPALALQLTEILISLLGLQLTDMTDSFGRLMQERSLPRRMHVKVQVEGQKESWDVPTGTEAISLLPKTIDQNCVVAALVNFKCVALTTPLMSDSHLSPLTVNHWEGERIYRHSAALLLLEAAHRLYPGLKLSMALSVGSTQWIQVDASPKDSLQDLAQDLQAMMEELIHLNKPFRHEWWAVEEAIPFFEDNNRLEAAAMMNTARASRVSLASCGEFYAISSGPLLPDTGYLKDLQVDAGVGGLILTTAKEGPSVTDLASYARLMHEHNRWLQSLQIHSVGHFNQACISGRVSQLIRVAEGFHEKRISQIADQIAGQREKLRIICIAGPSSSGKTTFIKRLSVQLQVNGITPLNISLDDYYVDREKTPLDANGELDYECLEALNIKQLSADLNALLSGETVATARYDFAAGRSNPRGGPLLSLGADNILLLEGIHGLNPQLLSPEVSVENLFRIFIQPMASLSLDEHSRINPSDLRLLRRIVRDRHSRATNAADTIMRWPSVRAGEHAHIFPFVSQADVIFDTSLIYELSVLKVYAERYLLEVPHNHPAYATAYRLQKLIGMFVALYPDHVPPTSILREFIGNSGFDY